MKSKTISTLFILFFISFFTHGKIDSRKMSFRNNNEINYNIPQNSSSIIIRTDSIYRWRWDLISGMWVYRIKELYENDWMGNHLSRIDQQWNGVGWDNYSRKTYTYDSNFNITISSLEYWDSTQWMLSNQYLSTYDSLGNYTYDIVQTWDGTNWTDVVQHFYWWSGNMRDSMLEQYLDSTGWVNNYFTSYTYDINHNELNRISYMWDGMQWIYDIQWIYFYNVNGDVSYAETQLWDDHGNWVNSSKAEYIYDINFVHTGDIYWRWDGSAWFGSGTSAFYYDANNIMNATVFVNQHSSDSTHYYFTNFTGMDEPPIFSPDISVFPIPTNDFLNIKIENSFVEDFKLSIYDLTGRELYYQSYLNSSSVIKPIDVSSFSSGIYYLKISSADKRFIKKIIRQ